MGWTWTAAALVLIEFAREPRVLPDDDPLVAGGAWPRLEEAASLDQQYQP